MSKLVSAAAILLFACSLVTAQGGGKAEPKLIEFASGAARLTGTLANLQEMDFVFAGKQGQRVTIKMSNPRLFDYRVFCREADFDTEFDSSPSSTIELPATCSYLLFVRKKSVRGTRTARFHLTLSVKDRPPVAGVRSVKRYNIK